MYITLMPIKNYDDPFVDPEREPPNQDIFKTRERLIKAGVIPARGKVAFTFELVQAMIKTWWNVVKSHASWRGRLLKKTGDYLDINFKLYTAYAPRLDKEVEITPELINEMTEDFVLYIFGGIANFIMKSDDPRAVKLQPSPSVKYWLEAIEADFGGEPDKAIEYLDKAVEMRADILPLMKRGSFFLRHDRLDKALADFSLAVKEGIPSEPYRARAYVQRGLCYIKKDMLSGGLADLVRAFEEFLKETLARKGEEDFQDLGGTVGFFVEECVPVVKAIDKQSTSLSDDNRQKLERVKGLILRIRQKTGE